MSPYTLLVKEFLMQNIKKNKIAPNFMLQTTDGEELSLQNLLAENQNVLLIFLRHLGWIPCREHVAQLCQHQEEFKKHNTRVLVISFGTLPAIQQWMSENCDHFTVLLDRDREVYNAYGLERSYWRSRNLKTRWYYFTARLRGEKTGDSHGDDLDQLGGDFIVGKDRKFKLVYPSHDPTDRPPVETLLKIVA